jgi:hypothetical protein
VAVSVTSSRKLRLQYRVRNKTYRLDFRFRFRFRFRCRVRLLRVLLLRRPPSAAAALQPESQCSADSGVVPGSRPGFWPIAFALQVVPPPKNHLLARRLDTLSKRCIRDLLQMLMSRESGHSLAVTMGPDGVSAGNNAATREVPIAAIVAVSPVLSVPLSV